MTAGRPCILVADAHEDTRALYRECLSGDGYEIEEAEDGRVALAKALSRRPVLVITEVTLPFVDGYELCQLLRRDPVAADVPILIVTAEQRPREVDRARAVAADALLVKPIAPAALVNEVRRLMSQAEESRGASHDAAADALPADLTAPRGKRASLNRLHERFSTKTPPAVPPSLPCPSCDSPLVYLESHIGGVSAKQREQWDYFKCRNCGAFQYRHRTRKLRRVS